MDYQLAKELKDAGYPQTGPSFSYADGDVETDEGGIVTVNSAYIPTLSELIEACGRAFRSLTWHSDGRWDAFIYSSVNKLGGTNHIGSTPEEAVARLWLALNKKA